MQGFAALDIGNHGWKGVNSQRCQYIPANLIEVDEDTYHRHNPNGLNPDACVIDGRHRILFGATAKKIQRHSPRGAARYEPGFYDFAVVIMLANLYQRSMDDLTLLLTYSPLFSAYTDEMIRVVKRTGRTARSKRKNDGYWEIEIGGKQLNFRIQRAGVKPEPVAALYNLQLTDDYKVAQNGLTQGSAIIIDLGGHTTDYAFCEDGLVENGSAFALDEGMFGVEVRFQDFLREAYPEAFRKGGIRSSRLHDAMATGIYRGGLLRGDLPVEEQRRRAMEPHIDDMMNLFTAYYGFDVSHILMAGGGGLAAQPYFEERLRDEFLRTRGREGRARLESMDKAGETFTRLATDNPNELHYAVVFGAFKMLQVLRAKGIFDD